MKGGTDACQAVPKSSRAALGAQSKADKEGEDGWCGTSVDEPDAVSRSSPSQPFGTGSAGHSAASGGLSDVPASPCAHILADASRLASVAACGDFGTAWNSLRTGVVPFLGLPLQLEPEAVPGVVLGAPFDGGVIHRPGARMGPWALRNATLGMGRTLLPLRFQGGENGMSGQAATGWVDGGNIPTRPFDTIEALASVAHTMGAWIEQGARTLMLGGDHLMTLGALRAHASVHGPLGLLVLDAHPDAADGALWGTAFHHGTWMRLAIEENLVDPHRVVQIGLRAPRHDEGETQFLMKAGVRLWTPWDLKDQRLSTQLQGDIARVGQGPAYVSIDLDALDPAFCPAVAEPVPGGMSVMRTISLLRQVHLWPKPWIGADVMELAATLNGAEETARVGVHLALHLLA